MWTQALRDEAGLARTCSRAESILHVLVVTLSLAGVGIALLSTSRYGVGLSPDSAGYISAARNLLAGEGLRCYDAGWYTYWPPLFPLCLAAIGLTGIDPAVAARFLNAFALGGIIFVAGMLLKHSLRSKCLVIIGTAAVLSCSLRLGIASMAWTEPIFVLLIIAFTFYMPAFFAQPCGRTVTMVSLIAALCSMQRYTGVTLIAAGSVLILLFLPNVTIRRRVRFLAIFLVISCMPLALWAVRNYMLTSRLSGMNRLPSIYSLEENAVCSVDTITKWFVPEAVPLSLRAGIVGLFILLSSAAIAFSCSRFAGKARRGCPHVWSLVVVLLTYIFLILPTHQVGVFDEIMNDRYLSPVSVLIVCLLLIGMDRAIGLLRLTPKVGWLLSGVATIALAAWLVHPATEVWERTQQQMRDGAGGYTLTSWRESPLVNWLCEHRLEGDLYSNAPEAIYALTDRGARTNPLRSQNLAPFREGLSSRQNKYLIWFSGVRRPYIYDLDEMILMFRMEKVAAVRDGAVYRLWSPNERSFPDGPIFSPCVVKGKWSRTFTSDRFGARGIIASWILQPDGTTDSTWVLNTGNGKVLRWHASCPYTRTGNAFEFRCEGRATRDGGNSESICTFSVRGTVDANTAMGTYRVEFTNAQWPSADSGVWRVDLARPVHRWYNAAGGRHLYSIARNGVSKPAFSPDEVEINEGVAFHAYPEGQQPQEAKPVHRFLCRNSNTYLYTLDESQKAQLIDQKSGNWSYEGIAWYAYSEDNHPFDAQPVYQFSLASRGNCFYTASESEKIKLINDPQHRWSYGGIAWYAVGSDAE
jgi:hypothetical protein